MFLHLSRTIFRDNSFAMIFFVIKKGLHSGEALDLGGEGGVCLFRLLNLRGVTLLIED